MDTSHKSSESFAAVPTPIFDPLRTVHSIRPQVTHKLIDVLFPATPPKAKNARLVRGIRI